MKIERPNRNHIDEITSILIEKYEEARLRIPLLSDKYEDKEKHMKTIEQMIESDSFIIATEEDKVIGFMYAFHIDHYKGTAKGALVLPSMHGVRKGYDKNKVYTALYKTLSDIWVESGCYTHSILMYENEKETIDTWVYNGFGLYVMDAVRSIDAIEIPVIDDEIMIRKANAADIKQLVPLVKGINEHLASAPIFLYDDAEEDIEEEYTQWLEREGNNLWVAEIEDELIGYLKTNTAEINQEEQNDGKTMGINGAYVKPEYRGRHIMSRLINLALEWARDNELYRCTTDFETANYEGRQYWLKHFTPYSYALIRRIDERNHIRKVQNIR